MWANMLLLTETSEWVSSFITLFRPAHTLSAAQHWRSGTFYNQEVLSLYLLVPLSSFRTERGPFSAPCPGPTALHLVWVQLQSAESWCADVLILNVSLCSKFNTSLPRVLRNNLPSVKKIWRRVSEMFLIRLNNQLHVLKDDLVNEHLGLITAS